MDAGVIDSFHEPQVVSHGVEQRVLPDPVGMRRTGILGSRPQLDGGRDLPARGGEELTLVPSLNSDETWARALVEIVRETCVLEVRE